MFKGILLVLGAALLLTGIVLVAVLAWGNDDGEHPPVPELIAMLENAETSKEEGRALLAIKQAPWDYVVMYYNENDTLVGPYYSRARDGETEYVEYIIIAWHVGYSVRHKVIDELNLLILEEEDITSVR